MISENFIISIVTVAIIVLIYQNISGSRKYRQNQKELIELLRTNKLSRQRNYYSKGDYWIQRWISNKRSVRPMKSSKNLSLGKCPICLDKIKKKSGLYGTKCKHYFHRSCLSSWFEYQNTCPICRRYIKYSFFF